MLRTEIKYDDFQYVVERKKPNKICFGAGVIRDTNPIGKGLSGFQKRFANELFPNVNPQTYDLQHLTSGVARLRDKVRSKRGVSGLANGAQRFSDKVHFRVPSPTRYDPEPKWKKSKSSGTSLGRKFIEPSKTPGPGTYDIALKRCRRTRTAYNFGRPRMIPCVEVLCVATAKDNCERCNAICENDYWHMNYSTFLCHLCMEEEKLLHEDYTQRELKEFTKIRSCWYKHSHEGTTAAVQLIPTHKIQKMERLENYLDLFISNF